MVREGELLGLLCLAVSVLANTLPWLEGPDHGEVHYFYNRHFLLPSPFGPWNPPIKGFSVKHGDHFSDKVFGVTHGNHYVDKSPSYSPGNVAHIQVVTITKSPGYVPVYGLHGYDISYGVSEGRDLLGGFSHFTGPYGPFGFWANLYHDRK